MEQTAIFSRRIRWLAVGTGVASALAFVPILLLLYPTLLIAGGIIQDRYPSVGRWFVWAGAASLWVAVIRFDAMMFLHPWRHLDYMVLTFAATTVLLTWCSVELVADALKRMRVRTSMPLAKPRPISRGVWIFAVVLNLLVCWEVAVGVLPPNWDRYSVIFYNLTMLLMLLLKQGIIVVVAFDIFLIGRIVKLRRVRRVDLRGIY